MSSTPLTTPTTSASMAMDAEHGSGYDTPPHIRHMDTATSWTGYAAFRVKHGGAPGTKSMGGGITLHSTGSDLYIHDELGEPAVINTIHWGEWEYSTWCETLKDVLAEAQHSKSRGTKGMSWKEAQDQWWMVLELTLEAEAIAGLVQDRAMSPSVERKSSKTWRIMRAISMYNIDGWHQDGEPVQFDFRSARCIGNIKRHLVKNDVLVGHKTWEDLIWENIPIGQFANFSCEIVCNQPAGYTQQCGARTYTYNQQCHKCWNAQTERARELWETYEAAMPDAAASQVMAIEDEQGPQTVDEDTPESDI